MQNTDTTPTRGESPFFELLAEADDIKIREVCPEVRQKLLSPSGSIGDIDDASHRTFLVHIKSKPVQAPAVVETAPEGAENRNYLLKSAELLIADEDFVLARNIYSYLLRGNLRDPEAMRGLGLCLSRLGDMTSAKKCFKALVELGAKEKALLWLGECHASEGEYAVALEELGKIVNVSALEREEQFNLYKEMGNCHTRLSQWDDAWASYHKALAVDPTSDALYVNLGTLETQRRHYNVAISYFNKALELQPRNPRAHCGLGLVALAQGAQDRAEAEFLQTLDLDSQNQVALFQLIALTSDNSKVSILKERLATFLSNDPRNVEAHYALAVVLFREGDWAGCERKVETLLALDPSHTKGRQLRDELAHNRKP